jgi:hypothetical protein
MPSRAEASRLNGSKSRGPKTEDGRRAASLNAVKHGLTAETVVLSNESEEEYQAELLDYLHHFAPANKPEADLVHQLAAAHWRLARYTGIETSLLEAEMEKKRKYVDGAWKNVDERIRLALAFESLSGAHSPLALLNRYQARLQHEYQRILKALLQLQDRRCAVDAKLQNEPKPDIPAAPIPLPAANQLPELPVLDPIAGRVYSPLLTDISESDITESDYETRCGKLPSFVSGNPAYPLGFGG